MLTSVHNHFSANYKVLLWKIKQNDDTGINAVVNNVEIPPINNDDDVQLSIIRYVVTRTRTRTLLTPNNRNVKFRASKTNKKYNCACNMTF